MTKHLGLVVWVAGALMLAAVGACTNSSDDPAGSASPSASVGQSSPAPVSTTPTPLSPSELAAADADALVHRYFAVLDRARQDRQKPLATLATVAVGTQLFAERKLIERERAQHLRQIGSTKVAALKVQSVNLDNSDPGAGKFPTAQVDVCWDVSDADLVDKAGRSVVSPGRANTGWTRYTLTNYHWSTEPSDGWRIASGHDLERRPCTVS